MTAAAPAGWTDVSDLVATLERRWASGRYLAAYAAGREWEPLALPVRGPRSGELLDRLDEVKRWLTRFERDLARHRDLRVEAKSLQGRRVGRNEVPARVWVDSYAALFRVLGVGVEVSRFDELTAYARERVPELTGWIVDHPRVVLEHRESWTRLVDVVRWIADRDVSGLYVRQVDVAGVDTKFIEQHTLVLAALLETALPAERVDTRFTRSQFTARFGLRRRPDYTRMRFLAPQRAFPPGVSEVTMRADELDRIDPGLGQVVIVENEISYLALPERADSLAIFGSGFALGSVSALTWLAGKSIIYWGDVDTYGFLILNRLRATYDRVTSILMDVETLLAHAGQWVGEDQPTSQQLPHLNEVEAETYAALVEDRYGRNVRLEQERIRFSAVRAALAEGG
jgi:hypothetical protein